MHPSSAALLAFCDAEAGVARSRRIAGHLLKCEKCRGRLRVIRSEKEELAAGAEAQPVDSRPGLAAVLSAIAAWRDDRAAGAASELKSRLRAVIETYFGASAMLVVDRPGLRAEELLGRASGVFEVFLGPEAAEAIREDVLRELDWAAPAGETCP